jgi:hypothetical protein
MGPLDEFPHRIMGQVTSSWVYYSAAMSLTDRPWSKGEIFAVVGTILAMGGVVANNRDSRTPTHSGPKGRFRIDKGKQSARCS